MRNESRFRMVERADPARYKKFVAESQAAAERRYAVYQQLAGITVPVSRRAGRRVSALWTRRRSDGPQHHLPGHAPAPSADRRARARSRDDLDTVKELEDAGAALLVLRSLYEEEITGEQMDAFFNTESHSESFAEAVSYAPEPDSGARTRRVPRASAAGEAGRAHPGDRLAQRGDAAAAGLRTRRLLEQAGADGLELQIYPRGQRHDDERGRGRTAGRRDRARA